MKSLKTYRYFILALIFLLAGTVVMAQDKEAEKKMQEAIQLEEMQAKKDQLQAEREMQKALQAEEMQARKDQLEEQHQQQQDQMRSLEREYADQARLFVPQYGEAPRVWSGVRSSGTFPEDTYLFSSLGQENQTQLTLRKAFRGTSSTSKGEFEVESGIRHFKCMISGSAKSGEIFIGVEYPDGKTFKELTINASADINFSQSITIKEGEAKKYTGSWNYVVRADKAEGNYMLQIMTH